MTEQQKQKLIEFSEGQNFPEPYKTTNNLHLPQTHRQGKWIVNQYNDGNQEIKELVIEFYQRWENCSRSGKKWNDLNRDWGSFLTRIYKKRYKVEPSSLPKNLTSSMRSVFTSVGLYKPKSKVIVDSVEMSWIDKELTIHKQKLSLEKMACECLEKYRETVNKIDGIKI